jgi:hypothetical protein
VFDTKGTDRLTEWRKIRDQLKDSIDPYQSVLEVWKRAPLVNRYLDPADSRSWPDPWHLILDDRYDDLALALGISYTLGLSERFMSSQIEIHMSISEEEENFFVITDSVVIDVGYRVVRPGNFVLPQAKRIWTYQSKL